MKGDTHTGEVGFTSSFSGVLRWAGVCATASAVATTAPGHRDGWRRLRQLLAASLRPDFTIQPTAFHGTGSRSPCISAGGPTLTEGKGSTKNWATATCCGQKQTVTKWFCSEITISTREGRAAVLRRIF